MFMTVYTWLTDQNRATPTTHGHGAERKRERRKEHKRQRQPKKQQRRKADFDPNCSGHFHW